MSRRFACGVRDTKEIECWGNGAPEEPSGEFLSVSSSGPITLVRSTSMDSRFVSHKMVGRKPFRPCLA